jgi:hypothetical protein
MVDSTSYAAPDLVWDTLHPAPGIHASRGVNHHAGVIVSSR